MYMHYCIFAVEGEVGGGGGLGGGGNVWVNLQHPFLSGSSAKKKLFDKNQEI